MKAIIKAKTDNERIGWEQARLVAYWGVVAQRGTKEFPSVDSLFRFSWEKRIDKMEAKRLTREEFLENAQKILDQ